MATTQDFEGIIYAPNYDLTLALQGRSAPMERSSLPTNQGQINSMHGANHQPQLPTSPATRSTIAQQLAKYNFNGDQGAYKKMQQDSTQITSDQTKLAPLQQQLSVLIGTSAPASSADDHAQGYNGIYGGFVARTIRVASKTHVHYDEVLRTAGPVNHYQVVNWFEDSLSHDASGSPEAFWWPTP